MEDFRRAHEEIMAKITEFRERAPNNDKQMFAHFRYVNEIKASRENRKSKYLSKSLPNHIRDEDKIDLRISDGYIL